MLFLFYWFVVAVVFVIGVIWIFVAAVRQTSTKPGLKMVIGAVIMFVIGAGACAALLSGL